MTRSDGSNDQSEEPVRKYPSRVEKIGGVEYHVTDYREMFAEHRRLLAQGREYDSLLARLKRAWRRFHKAQNR